MPTISVYLPDRLYEAVRRDLSHNVQLAIEEWLKSSKSPKKN